MSETSEPRIVVSENGPYRVSGSLPIRRGRIVYNEHGESVDWEVDDAVETGKRYSLCRCGRSSTKPFCDDTHLTWDFDGSEGADRGSSAERREAHAGERVTITDDRELCIHAAFRVGRSSDVWHEAVEASTDEEVARVRARVARCPSGRLELFGDDGDPLEPEVEPSVVAVEDGPYWIRGGIAIESADGSPWEARNRVTLCRCGRSTNKPFCDGTHLKIHFRA